MILSELLNPELVLCDAADISTKKQILESMGHLVCHQHTEINFVEMMQAWIQRERLGSTILGHGVAAPRAVIADLEKPVITLITLHKGIQFYEDEAVDVDVVFGVLAPKESESEQESLITTLTSYIESKAYRDGLRQAASNNALYRAAIKVPA